MTSVRKSTVVSKEASFGQGKGSDYEYITLPAGYKFSHTPSRSTTRIQTPGTKRFDNIAYGAFSGSWELTWMLDWNYLEPLQMFFEDYKIDEAGKDGVYVHTFRKSDTDRVGSYVFREVWKNTMAGGTEDEIVELTGCVVKSISFSKSAGSSQTQVTMSGFYSYMSTIVGTLLKTDYHGYKDVNLAEYMCLFIGPLLEDNYVANTESLTLSMDNSVEAIYNVCSPFAGQYVEGITNYAFSTVALANDPRHYRLRLNSGGKDNTHLKPMSKGLAPIDEMHIISYCEEAADHGGKRTTAYYNSEESLDVNIDRCVIKSVPYQNGDGSKLEDSISSSECREIYLKFVTKRPTYKMTSDNDHKVTVITMSTISS